MVIMYKRVMVFRENIVSVIVSTFLLFVFVDQLSLVDVFSQLYYLTDAKKQNNNVGLIVINTDFYQLLSIDYSGVYGLQATEPRIQGRPWTNRPVP